MNLFSKRDKWIIAVFFLAFVLFIVFMQFFYLRPLKSDLAAKQQTLSSEQKLLAVIGQQSRADNGAKTENTTELQKQLPVKPLQDQFILDLEKAETEANSEIQSMGFANANGEQVATADSQANSGNTAASQQTNQEANGTANKPAGQSTTAAESQQTGQLTNSTGNQQNGQNNSAPQQATALSPSAGINKLTVQLSVQSPSYEDFEKFIETLEGLKRIVTVESINYTGPAEVTSFNQNTQPFTYSLTVSAYYMPGLTDLQNQLPNIDTPEPAKKDNPLSRFANLTIP